MINGLKTWIKKAFYELKSKDGILFEISTANSNSERKLHEICINHKLSNYLEKNILPKIQKNGNKYFVDIEFNRLGINEKEVILNGKPEIIRPDIIIHNRKSGNAKKNFIIVECKKISASKQDKKHDINKIKALMKSKDYNYNYGLQVIYNNSEVSGTLYYKSKGKIRKYAL